MDEAARARAAAREAIDETVPERLREVIDHHLNGAPATPGALTLLAAQAADREYDAESLERRAAGVQLIYDGLQLTRRLARTNPWGSKSDSTRDGADVEILAADVLVARGFYLLARTEAAGKAVETVQAFGRDETDRFSGRTSPDLDEHTLEADVFELAILAGTASTGPDIPAGVRSFAIDLARSFDPNEAGTPELISEPTVAALAAVVADREPSPASTEAVWARSSVTDP
ncbi:MAG: hypothetical protein R3324_21110 [Halobacteriales archaeon]|nr:hypothetical protein [Halobacteriales archaeon]